MSPELQQIAQDQPYQAEAYEFVLRSLNTLLAAHRKPRHVNGVELSEAIRQDALREFGPMGKYVLNRWGIHSSRDFGEIVFHLVEAGILRKTEDDRIEDFDRRFDFDAVFERDYYATRESFES